MNYRDFQGELERLHAEQERVRRREKTEAVARIKALMAEYAMTPDELADRLGDAAGDAPQHPDPRDKARTA